VYHSEVDSIGAKWQAIVFYNSLFKMIMSADESRHQRALCLLDDDYDNNVDKRLNYVDDAKRL
jgi:hypothetical protein